MSKNTIIFSLFLTLCVFSCNHAVRKHPDDAPQSIKQKIQQKDTGELFFIEHFFKHGATVKDIQKYFGPADDIVSIKQVPEKIHEYNNKEKEWPAYKWAFGVNKSGKIKWLNYRPWENPLLDRVEVLPTTLKKYSCKKERKPDKSSIHFIVDETFFSCAGGKIMAYYNIHGEISLIEINDY